AADLVDHARQRRLGEGRRAARRALRARRRTRRLEGPVVRGLPVNILAGRRVVDVTASLAGPYCTQLLGALGAAVTKVEPPEGDHARAWGPPFVGEVGALWFAANAGKESVTLDLRRERPPRLELVDTLGRIV